MNSLDPAVAYDLRLLVTGVLVQVMLQFTDERHNLNSAIHFRRESDPFGGCDADLAGYFWRQQSGNGMPVLSYCKSTPLPLLRIKTCLERPGSNIAFRYAHRESHT